MLAVVIAEAVAIALLALLVAGLLRGHAEVLRTLHDLGADLDPDGHAHAAATPRPARTAVRRGSDSAAATGGPAHDVTGLDLAGAAVSIGVAGAGHDTVLAFLSSSCHTCLPFWHTLRDGASTPAGARVVVVVRDADEESPARLAELAGEDLVVVASTQAWDDYAVPGSPHFVHVEGPASRVRGEGSAASWAQVLDLLGQASADRAATGNRPPAWLPDPTPLAGGRDNATRIDGELAAAGIGPGHPSLFPAAARPEDPR